MESRHGQSLHVTNPVDWGWQRVGASGYTRTRLQAIGAAGYKELVPLGLDSFSHEAVNLSI